MKPIHQLDAEELAAFVCQSLSDAGITVTLTGGACVSIWSAGKYVSSDLDFIEEGFVTRRQLIDVMSSIGFRPQNRYFVHPDTAFFVEFPTGPLTVGEERVHRIAVRHTSVGTLRLLSATDCVKDRLAAFYHWKDQQAFEQAVMVTRDNQVDLEDVARWSKDEGEVAKFQVFMKKLAGP